MSDQPTERRHVETFPNEPVAPEIIDHPIRPEPGGHTQADDINVGLVTVIGICSAILLVVIIVILQAWFYSWTDEEQQLKTEPSAALQKMVEQQQSQLHGYHWANEAQKRVQIPIDQAMKLVVAEESAAQSREVEPNHGNPKTP